MFSLPLRLTAMKYSHATKRIYSGTGTKERRFRSNVQTALGWQRDLASDQPIEIFLNASHLLKDEAHRIRIYANSATKLAVVDTSTGFQIRTVGTQQPSNRREDFLSNFLAMASVTRLLSEQVIPQLRCLRVQRVEFRSQVCVVSKDWRRQRIRPS
jgi:hypothetical protein